MSRPTDLREQLGGVPDPEFDLDLPQGWIRYEATRQQQDQIATQVRARMMQEHRPDLAAQMQQLLDVAWQGMKSENVVAWFGPGPDAPDEAYWPASLTASIRSDPAGGPLDAVVAQAIREFDAGPLLGDRRFITFEREFTEQLQGETLALTTIVYLTPVPLTNRKRGLQLTATIMRPASAPADDAPVETLRAAFNLCVSTLSWRPPASLRP